MKLFKAALAASLSMAMIFSMAGCAKPVETPPAETPVEGEAPEGDVSAGNDKIYTIATDTTFAPFEFQDAQGNFVGIDMDLINAIAEEQGFKIKINPLGFDAAVQAVKSGQADAVIAGMSITEERKEAFDFSDPYFDSGVVMGISSDNKDIKGYEDLKGKKVAVKVGTEGRTFAESIAKEYGFEMATFDDSNNMYQDVITGNSVACFEDYPVLGYAITQGMKLQIVTDMEAGNSYGIGVAKGKNAELLTMINDGLKNAKDSGKYQEILDTYIQK